MEHIFAWFMNNPWATALLMVVFIAISTLMVLAILIQRPQGGGLSAAFGGGSAGSGQTAFGTKTGDALTWFTISVFAAFLLFGILLNYATTPVAIAAPDTTATSTNTEAPAGGETPASTAPPITPPNGQPAEQPAAAPQTAPPATEPVTPPATSPAPSSNPAPAPAPAPAPTEPAPKN
ncbi:MAG: preprotein translocase subunit SecG [Phycisphaerae bacterium]|nr:preprotein translocase subunit SecG [Phycisphaerae bacterium]